MDFTFEFMVAVSQSREAEERMAETIAETVVDKKTETESEEVSG